MAKHELRQRERQVSTEDGIGKELERTLTVDDTCLPTAEELGAYQKIDSSIVPFLIEVSRKEQEHRHKMDKEKIRIVGKSDTRIERMNWWGMCFAFLSIAILVALSGYALYLDKPWFAGIMGAGTMASIASIFVIGKHPRKNK